MLVSRLNASHLSIIGVLVPASFDKTDPRPSNVLWFLWEAERTDAGLLTGGRPTLEHGNVFSLLFSQGNTSFRSD